MGKPLYTHSVLKELNTRAIVNPVSVLLVEDEDFLRTAMEQALKRHRINIVGTASSSTEAMQIARETKIDVAVLDVNLGGGPNGIDLAHGLRKINSNIGLVFVTSYSDVRFAGIRSPEFPENAAYIVKKNIANIELIVQIIQAVSNKSVKEKVLKLDFDQRTTAAFTDLQVEMMHMIHLGLSNSQIAKVRGTTIKSAENSIARLAKKLDIPNTSEVSQRVLIARKFSDLSEE